MQMNATTIVMGLGVVAALFATTQLGSGLGSMFSSLFGGATNKSKEEHDAVVEEKHKEVENLDSKARNLERSIKELEKKRDTLVQEQKGKADRRNKETTEAIDHADGQSAEDIMDELAGSWGDSS